MIFILVRALALACRGHHELVLENLALRQQLNALRRQGTRPHLGRRDRLFWIVLAKTWRHWRTGLVLVHPETVMRWHREWLRRRWTRRSRVRPGRPSTDVAFRTLVKQMATANPLWGAPRIHGELGKLGVEVSERTISRLLRRPRRPPSQTWRTYLTNHVATLVSIDFFTVPTLTGRVLFVFLVLMHHRRRIVHVNVTAHPTAAWTAQQMIEAFPDDTGPRWLLRDRDAIYGDAFRRRVAGMGIGEVLSSPSSPWQNPYAERLIGSIRRECLVDLTTRVLAIPVKRTTRRLVHFLTREEMDALLVACNRATWAGRRDHALLLTLYNTGARVSELAALRRAHVRFGSRTVMQLLGKGRKERVVPLWTRTSRILRQWFEELGDGSPDYAFPNVHRERLTRHGIAYLLHEAVGRASATCPSLATRRVSPHVIRHTTAMHLFQAGVDLATIALWLGHERLETTHLYVEADLATKQQALEKLAPLGQSARRFKADDAVLGFLASL